MVMLKKDVDLKTLKNIWSKTKFGKKEGRAMASMIYMMLLDNNASPPWSMKEPVTPDIGRKVRVSWGDSIVEGKLIGYDNWGTGVVVKESRKNGGRTYYLKTVNMEFI